VSWWEGRIGCFDIETTGVDTEDARIVSAVIASVGEHRDSEVVSLIVNPWVDIPAGASEVHGIHDEVARFTGVPAELAIPAIVESIRAIARLGRPLTAYNARYDFTVLDREARRWGVEPLDMSEVKVIDPYVLDKHVHRFRKGSRKLVDVCAWYGAKLGQAHDAGADAIAAARLAWRICSQGQVIRRVRDQWEEQELADLNEEWDRVRLDLDLLYEAQRRWAAEQAAGLRDYFERSGDLLKAAEVSESWPVVPLGERELYKGPPIAAAEEPVQEDIEAAKMRLFG
jgi:DNA polymerase-3 subunit epsilon